MRCPQCHYTSFDHLSVCDRCGADLSEVRRKLNLLDFRPNLPDLFVLHDPSLDTVPPEVEEAPSAIEEAPAADELPFDLSLDEEDTGIRHETSRPYQTEPVLHLDDGEELSGIEMGDSGGLDAPVMLDLEDARDEGEEAGLGAVVKPLETGGGDGDIAFEIDDDELELELSEEEMERIIMELEDAPPDKKRPRPEALDPDGEIALVLDDDEGESS